MAASLILSAAMLVIRTSAGNELETSVDWKERLLKEAPEQWKALDQFNLHLGGSYTEETRVFGPGTYGMEPAPEPLPGIGGKDVSRFRRNGSWFVSEDRIQRYSKDGTTTIERVDGRNSRYSFRLTKEGSGGAYVLKNLSGTDTGSEQTLRAWNSHVRRPACNGAELFSEYMKRPDFALKDVTTEQRGPKMLVRVRYAFAAKNEKESINDGYFLFDPEAHWALRELGFSCWFGQASTSFEYGQNIDGFPILRRTVDRAFGKQPTKENWTESVCEFAEMVHKEFPESDFTISAFGLPEIDPTLAKPDGHLLYWIVGLAIASGVIAILLRQYGRRRLPCQ